MRVGVHVKPGKGLGGSETFFVDTEIGSSLRRRHWCLWICCRCNYVRFSCIFYVNHLYVVGYKGLRRRYLGYGHESSK